MDWGDLLMKSSLTTNAINNISKRTIIYEVGRAVNSVALVLKGRVLVYNSGSKVVVNAGSFIGINDLYLGRFVSTYTALEDTMMYVFSVEDKEDLDQILSTNKEYHGVMVTSLNKLIAEMDQFYQGLIKLGVRLRSFIEDLHQRYRDIINNLNYMANSTDIFENIALRGSDLELQRERINYYKEINNVPLETIKEFYSYGNIITLYQIEDQSDLINNQIEALTCLVEDINSMINRLYDDSENCIFNLFAALGLQMMDNTGNSKIINVILKNIIAELKKSEKVIEVLLAIKVSMDWSRMTEILARLQTGDTAVSGISNETYLKYSEDDTIKALEEMKDSFHKIVRYGELDAEAADDMYKTLEIFIHSRDKKSLDNDARTLRRKLTDYYYELYKKVFIKRYHNPNADKIIDMFLNYGFLDERLLTKEQLIYLYFLENGRNRSANTREVGPSNVYTIKEWLIMIYEGKKEPSKNEFDLEYAEYLRSLHREGRITEEEQKLWRDDPNQRLDYEIKNMFRYNNRTTNGQITSFIPILHKDMIVNDLEKTYLTADKVNKVIKELMEIDYSVFDRELIYSNPEAKIVREYVIRRVYPDIILMPTVGTNGIMWQEIAGRRRDSAGRFLMPIFMEGDLRNTMVRLFGRFRWELCRTIEGSAWNDIKNKSLTSEYTDYLQFYRKNKELSEETKQKIKLQIQKGRNSSREIFVMDYENWINYESTGAIKLNKFVREIMATYCPFTKQIREKLLMQPLFEEAMLRYQREKMKKIRETETRYRMLEKDKIELPEELVFTLNYYKDF